MATVIKPNGKEIIVKNLGWILKHAKDVIIITICPQSHFTNPRKGYESRMIATLADGTRYFTDWASTEVCRQWFAARKRTFKSANIIFS